MPFEAYVSALQLCVGSRALLEALKHIIKVRSGNMSQEMINVALENALLSHWRQAHDVPYVIAEIGWSTLEQEVSE